MFLHQTIGNLSTVAQYGQACRGVDAISHAKDAGCLLGDDEMVAGDCSTHEPQQVRHKATANAQSNSEIRHRSTPPQKHLKLKELTHFDSDAIMVALFDGVLGVGAGGI